MLKVCENAEDFTLVNYFTNQNVSLSDYQGKTILVSFLNAGCGHCDEWLENMQNIWLDHETGGKVQIIGVVFNKSSNNAATTADVQKKIASSGINITFPLLMDVAKPNSVAQKYLMGLVGPNIWYPYSYIISKDFKVVSNWHFQSTANSQPLTFDSTDLLAAEFFVRETIEKLEKPKDVWDTVLVLDYSGSMDDPVTIDNVSKPKIEFLKEAVEIFLNLWLYYAVCIDRIGTVFFESEAETDKTFYPILPGDNVKTVISKIKAHPTGNCTAMGAGLGNAIELLKNSTNKKFIVLFTDGMQNRNPLVVGNSPLNMKIDNVGQSEYPTPFNGLCNGGQANYSGTLPITLNSALDINIHTIGVGIYGGWQDVLANISSATGGKFNAVDTVGPDLTNYFIETLIELYRGNSLHLVTKESGTLENNVSVKSKTFTLSKCVNKFSVVVNWVDKAHPLKIKLVKGGKTIELKHKTVDGETYQIATIEFPHYQKNTTKRVFKPKTKLLRPIPEINEVYFDKGDVISPEGEWELIIERRFSGDNNSNTYNLSVIADDKTLEMEMKKSKNIYSLGDEVPISINLVEKEKPVNNIYAEGAVVHSPKTYLEDIIPKIEKLETLTSLHRKMEVILQQKKTISSLFEKEKEIVKINKVVKDGSREGLYPRAKIPGIYNVDVLVKGIGNKCGVFEMMETRSFIVKPKK